MSGEIEAYKLEREYMELTGAGRQAVDLYLYDRVSWVDVPQEAREFLAHKGFVPLYRLEQIR